MRDCLRLQPGETLAVFYDETTDACARLLIQAAEKYGLTVIERRVPIAEQVKLASAPQLPQQHTEALQRSSATLLCLGSRLEATPYRKRLVKRGVGDGPLGTMPGATLEVLAHAVNVDYEEASRKCGDLAIAMLIGSEAVISSYIFGQTGETTGPPRTLKLQLGGFRRSPITSPGIIVNGTWGNLPGGETFIAPIEGTAEGIFVLNGAFTGHVLKPWQPILLHFHKGELVEIEGAGPEADALRQMCEQGTAPGTRLGLAELGIGVNPGIAELKGNALFDEKKEGTVHIAVGDNEEYGGKLSAAIHEDFITSAPSLSIDGKSVLERGKWAFNDADWRENAAQALLLGQKLPGRFLVQRRLINTSTDTKQRLVVRRDVGAKRVCIYTVGMDDLSRELAVLYDSVPDSLEPIQFDLLMQQHQDTNLDHARGLLAVLERHELVAIQCIDDDWDGR